MQDNKVSYGLTIFDIDDTLIDSRTHTIIKPVYQLYKYCQNKGYNIYIITARPRIPYGVQLTFWPT